MDTGPWDQGGEPFCRGRVKHVRQPRRVVEIGQEADARVIGELGRLGLDMRAHRTERVH